MLGKVQQHDRPWTFFAAFDVCRVILPSISGLARPSHSGPLHRKLIVLVTAVASLSLLCLVLATSTADAALIYHARSDQVAVVGQMMPLTTGNVAGVPEDSFDQFTFTGLDVSEVDPSSLAPFDTVVLNQVSTVDLTAAARAALNSFVTGGGKLIIHDSDETAGNDYSWLVAPASTGSSCPNCGATDGTSQVLENNTMVSSDPVSPAYVNVAELQGVTDAVGDANVFVTQDPRWFKDIQATNTGGSTGAVHTYASIGGLIIYDGYDTDPMGTTEASGVDWLGKLWYLELAQQWSPDGLPHGVPVVQAPPLVTFYSKGLDDFPLATPKPKLLQFPFGLRLVPSLDVSGNISPGLQLPVVNPVSTNSPVVRRNIHAE